MARGLKPIDISQAPELLRLAEEVRRTAQGRVLRLDDEDLAIVMPVRPRRKREPKPDRAEAKNEAFRSAFGGWKGIVDATALKKDLASSRGSNRPPVSL